MKLDMTLMWHAAEAHISALHANDDETAAQIRQRRDINKHWTFKAKVNHESANAA